MAAARVLCFAILAPGAAAIKKSQLQVNAAGFIGETDLVDQNDVVRRVQKGTEVNKASVFAGLERTDVFSTHPGVNCSSKHGGADLGKQMLGTTVEQCKKACAVDDDCTCISHEATKGICSKQKNCYLESCVPSSLVHTYQLHSSFKVKAKSAKGHGNGVYENESFAYQNLYERSGGRDCATYANVTVLSTGHYDTPKDVVQCLSDCEGYAGCECVKFERYYQKACTLMANCPLPTFCQRSNEYDAYVKLE
jgi:hypothetical protein